MISIETFEALTIAEIAQKSWANEDFTFRARAIQKVGDLLLENLEGFSALISREMYKPLMQSKAEIEKSAKACYYFSGLNHETKYLGFTEDDQGYQLQPVGLILGIMPWNFPCWQVLRFVLPNLLIGNTCILKHAPNVWESADLLTKIINEATKLNTLTNLKIEIQETEALIAHPKIAGVTFTGSEAAGRKIASLSGAALKKTVLELGGSDPFIVTASANLPLATKTAVQSRMINSGQSCIAAKRFLIQQEVYDDFKNYLLEELKSLNFSHDLVATSYSKLARKDLAEKLVLQVNKSIEMGAKLLFGVPAVTEDSLVHPIVLENIAVNMPVFNEETFGPVFPLIPFQTIEEAITLANLSNYGLGATVFTQEKLEIKVFQNKIEAGSVFFNTLMRSEAHLPFGGIKNSGYGRELSALSLFEFANVKTIVKA